MFKLLRILFICLFIIVTGNLSAQNPVNHYKAPLYWDVYENNYLKEQAGVANNYITEDDFLANINWVDTNLKNLGYNIICIDGWGDVDYNQDGYRTKHSSAWIHDYAWWSTQLKQRGMTLGMYYNPLWVNTNASNAGIKVKGTNILLSSLINTSENALWFTWLQVDRPGAEEYVKGYIQYYADMGVKYLRVDFLSWFESGYDRSVGTVGPVRPLAYYQNALQWMREACDANGMFLSLVMPNLNSNAVTEQKYGHMVRINEDCAQGGWTRFSDSARGIKRLGWSQFANPFDGYVYWSKIAGRGKMILDGDFIRLNTYLNDEERKSVVSLHLMAGGPISIADQYNTIGSSLWIYQNEELLALNQDGFVGVPLSNDPTNSLSQIWKGQMTNGDWVVGLFNRESNTQTRSINLQTDLGISGNAFVRDLWSHFDLGAVSSLSKSVPAHGCLIFRISTNTNKVISPVSSQKSGIYSGSCAISITSTTSGATIYYTTDGSTPTSASSVYSNPITFTTTTTLRTIASKSGMTDSYVSKDIYTITVPTPQTAMFVAGTFNNWDPATLPMKNTGANNWTTNAVSISTGSYEMKFANTTSWTGDDWGNTSGLSGITTLSTGGLPNLSFTIPATGNYTFLFNDATLAYSINNILTNVSEFESSDIHVNNILSINRIIVDMGINENAEIEIITLNGQIVCNTSTNSKSTIINLKPQFKNVILLVKVKTKTTISTFKVIL